ncbi:hypothetical protein B0T14DRAFT_597035 [Immersiella caudata]|uniref:Uncharacterized protein n=1 Tax=Immersiella caudata TaxID=314043 RepID=A0AA40CBK5_9PEZI|nr:hypothetical protein B0T14DRAFT_597035 [Immersiella caudata]
MSQYAPSVPASKALDSEAAPLLARKRTKSAPPAPFVKTDRREILTLVCCIIFATSLGTVLFNDSLESSTQRQTIEPVVGIFLVLPYTYMSRRSPHHRAMALYMAMGSVFVERAARAVLYWYSIDSGSGIAESLSEFTPIIHIVGGGPQVVTAMAYALLMDVYPAAERAGVFLLVGAVTILSGLVGSPLATTIRGSTSDANGLHYAVLIGVMLQIIAFGLAACPSTYFSHDKSLNCQDTPWWELRLDDVRESSLLSQNARFTMKSAFLAGIGTRGLQTVSQYGSERFWRGEVVLSREMAYSSVMSIAALSILVPVVKTFLTKRMSSVGRDRTITKASAWSLAVGSFIMALASTSYGLFLFGMGIAAAGSGYHTTIFALGASLVPASDMGMMCALLLMAQSFGGIVAAPLVSLTLGRGMELGGVWSGLPFMFATAALSGAACLIGFGVRVTAGENGSDGLDDAEKRQAWTV